jgi:hypothetical protein
MSFRCLKLIYVSLFPQSARTMHIVIFLKGLIFAHIPCIVYYIVYGLIGIPYLYFLTLYLSTHYY